MDETHSSRSRQHMFDHLEKKCPTAFQPNDDISASLGAHSRLLIDCDGCLDRLYGGYYPDWQSGGEWRNLKQFWQEFKYSCTNNKLEMVLFFDGTSPSSYDSSNWTHEQLQKRAKINRIMNTNLDLSKTDWLQPNMVATQIQLEIINQNSHQDNQIRSLFFFQSITQHERELIELCMHKKCIALFTANVEVVGLVALLRAKYPDNEALRSLRIFNARSMKLTFRRGLKANEINIDLLLGQLGMNPEQFLWFSTFYGDNKHVPWFILNELHQKMNVNVNSRNSVDYLITLISNASLPLDLSKLTSNFLSDTKEDLNIKKKLQKAIERCINIKLDELNYAWCINETEYNFQYNNKPKPDINDCVHELLSTLNTFSLEEEKEQKLQKIIEILHISCMKSPIIYHMLCYQKLYIPVTMEPIISTACNSTLIKADEIYRPLREYCYSLLFTAKNQKDLEEDAKMVEEIVVDTQSNTTDCIRIEIVPLEEDFIRVWQSSSHVKMKHFYNSFKMPALEHSTFVNLTKECYFVGCCVLRYMLQFATNLTRNDYFAFLTTFIKVRNTKKINAPRERQDQHYIIERKDTRAMHLASLFIRGVENAHFANDTCGNPIKPYNFLLSNYFDGSVFHEMYTKFHEQQKLDTIITTTEELNTFNCLFGTVSKDLERRFQRFIDPSPYHNLLRAIKIKEMDNEMCSERDRLNSNKSDGSTSRKANFSLGRGLLKNFSPRIEIKNEPDVSIWDNSHVSEEQVEDCDEVYDIYMKNIKPKLARAKNSKKIKSNKTQENEKPKEKEKTHIIHFEDSVLAKDYVPFFPNDGFIPNRSENENEQQEKVLRFKWTEKLERESRVSKPIKTYQQPFIQPRVAFRKLEDLPTLVSKKTYEEMAKLNQTN